MSIFDLITSNEIVAYWEMDVQGEPPFLGEELFPSQQKLGLNLEWIKGKSGLPVVLKPSAYDVAAIPRKRIAMEKLSASMPFFKESAYIDEEMRQELNKVIETGNRAIIDVILGNIFDDEIELLRGARSQRERMRMMLISTGTIMVEGNGQAYEYDYHFPEDHKATVSMSWNNPKANIIEDIQAGIDKILKDTGVTVTRAICSKKILGYMRKNEELKWSILAETEGRGHLSDRKILTYLEDELGIQIATNDLLYKDENEKEQRYIPDDVLILIPSGNLGKTWFGVTPEQSDLMSNPDIANVSMVDTGVAVTTMKKADPVQVETKVSMICLPDLPVADQIYILDVIAE